ETAHYIARQLQEADLPTHTVAVSVAMFGRWYKLRYENDSRTERQPVGDILFDMCQETGYDEQLGSVTQLCSQKRRVMQSMQYGLAAFNLEYADGRGECGDGAFAELGALRRLVGDNLSDDICRLFSRSTAENNVARSKLREGVMGQ
ncbi:hypothetical protein MTO96_039849, partial [Rhipicephalus appendiculatus]